MLLVSDHLQGFADRVLSNFDILFVKDKAAVKFTCAHLEIKVYTHNQSPIRETTGMEFKDTQAQWVHINIRGADGARIDELEIYGGSNPLSVNPVSKLAICRQ